MEPLPTDDPYKTLNVGKDAQIPEIRSAYRKLVLKCHPDKVTDPQLKEQKADEFQKVQLAYELLCDEDRRADYDDRVKLQELRQQKRNVEANTSAARTPPRHTHYEVRTAEPRPDTYKTKSSSRTYSTTGSSKMYAQYSSSRSWEDDIQSTTSNRHYDEPHRSTRRTVYEDKPSRREEDREREKRRKEEVRRVEKEERRREDQEEKERAIRAAEAKAAERAAAKAAKEAKEARRAEKEREKKVKEKQRKRDAEDKRSTHKSAYIEHYEDEDPVHLSKEAKKKSSKKHDDKDKRARSHSREDEPVNKADVNMMAAVNYMQSARNKSGPQRAHTFHDAYSSTRYEPPPVAPTPPSAHESAFNKPPPRPSYTVEVDSEDDSDDSHPTYRPAAKPSITRRSTDTPKTTRDRSSHKASTPGSREQHSKPTIIDPPSTTPTQPHLSKSTSTPPVAPESPPRNPKLHRSQTVRETEYTRSVPQHPPIHRASTYQYDQPSSRGRERSRMHAQVQIDEETDSEEERRIDMARRKAHSSRHHRQPSPEEYESYAAPKQQRYQWSGGRTIPMEVQAQYYDDVPLPRKSKTQYYAPSEVKVSDRPSMPSRDSAYSSGPYYPKVKRSESYMPEDVAYSMPQKVYWEESPMGRA